MMRLVLHQPDIPQNTGAILRLAACMGVGVDIIEPCGFVLDDKRLRRAGMDYLEMASYRRHDSWRAFRESVDSTGDGATRLILLSTRGDQGSESFRFRPDDALILGSESAGVPADVHKAAAARLRIPMVDGARSLNVALAAAMVLGEALRQTNQLPVQTFSEEPAP